MTAAASLSPAAVDEPAAPLFAGQWDASVAAVTAEIREALRTVDVRGTLEPYGGGLGLYLKVPFLLACHVADPALRDRIAAILALHIVAMKLLDDAIDRDSDLEPIELGAGSVYLASKAGARMAPLDPGRAARALIAAEVEVLTRGQIRTKAAPAEDLAEWRAYADIYGGGFLRIYGRLATLLSDQPALAEAVAGFAYAFGMIITLADDIVDYTRKGERAGNIGHLLATGVVEPEKVAAMVRELREACHDAVRNHPRGADLARLAAFYAGDVEGRILPQHMKQVSGTA